MNAPDPQDLPGLDAWILRERSRGAPPGFADRVMAAVALHRQRGRVPRWVEVAAVALAAPVLVGRLVALALVFLP